MKIKLNAIIITHASKLILMLSIICFLLSLMSFIVIPLTSELSFDLNFVSFNNLQEIFSFPLKLFGLFSVLLGIWITIIKYQQTERQFKNTHKLTIENIHFNNYTKHRELYINSMLDYFDYFKDNIAENTIIIKNNYGTNVCIDTTVLDKILSKGFHSLLYRNWFEKDIENFRKIQPDVIYSLNEYSNFVFDHIDSIFSEEQFEHYETIHNLLKNLKLDSMKIICDPSKLNENNFRLKTTVAIIKNSLDFSEQSIKNINKIYIIACREKP